jgi:hypothetical protein
MPEIASGPNDPVSPSIVGRLMTQERPLEPMPLKIQNSTAEQRHSKSSHGNWKHEDINESEKSQTAQRADNRAL